MVTSCGRHPQRHPLIWVWDMSSSTTKTKWSTTHKDDVWRKPHWLTQAIWSSPTPAYPKDGKRAGAEVAQAASPSHRKLLEKENAKLLTALKAAHDELESLKAAAALQGKAVEAPPSRDLVKETSIDDPFAPKPNLAPGTIEEPDSFISKTPELPNDDEPKLSLEGTLESLRVQAEQLLEVQDDIMAENRRFSRKLAMRSQRSSPLRAAS